jgi:hypothetical protein
MEKSLVVVGSCGLAACCAESLRLSGERPSLNDFSFEAWWAERQSLSAHQAAQPRFFPIAA